MSHNSFAADADLRVRRTQKLLQEAFMGLVVEEGFDAITIQMLADRAMVNRATFYRHYQDKYDLAEQVYAALTAEYRASIAGLVVADPLQGWELLFAHVAKYAAFYLALLSDVPHFREYVCRNIERELLAVFQEAGFVPEQAGLPVPLALRYLATAQMGVIQWWLENDQAVPAEQMAQYLWQCHAAGAMQALRLPVPISQESVNGA